MSPGSAGPEVCIQIQVSDQTTKTAYKPSTHRATAIPYLQKLVAGNVTCFIFM